MIMTPNKKATKVGPVVARVARVRACTRTPARDPATASARMIGTKRPTSMTDPNVASYQVVLADSPANAEPLLLAADANA